jgi:AraC family transcriptional regulator
MNPPRFETLPKSTFVGLSACTDMVTMPAVTMGLWRSFMPIRHQITNVEGIELYSFEEFPADYFNSYNPEANFTKWAAVKVSDIENLPPTLSILEVPEGLYAVFLHKGPQDEGAKTYQYIFGEWMRQSDYAVDDRPHFAVMDEKYKPNEVDSEEEIWVPVKQK